MRKAQARLHPGQGTSQTPGQGTSQTPGQGTVQIPQAGHLADPPGRAPRRPPGQGTAQIPRAGHLVDPRAGHLTDPSGRAPRGPLRQGTVQNPHTASQGRLPAPAEARHNPGLRVGTEEEPVSRQRQVGRPVHMSSTRGRPVGTPDTGLPTVWGAQEGRFLQGRPSWRSTGSLGATAQVALPPPAGAPGSGWAPWRSWSCSAAALKAGRPPPTSRHRDGRFYPVVSVQLLLGRLPGRGWHRGDEPREVPTEAGGRG